MSALRAAEAGFEGFPLLGSHLAAARLAAVAKLYKNLVFWLDSDKWKESTEIARRAGMMGLSAKVVYSELDPKCYTNEEIRSYVNG